MRILHCISSGGFFGAENVLVELVNELLKEEDCHPIVGVFENSLFPNTAVAEVCRDKGIETVIFPCRGRIDVATIRMIRDVIRSRDIDIIHAHGYKSDLYCYAASLGLGVIRIATCHNWLGENARMRLYAASDRLVLSAYNRIAAVSDELMTKIIASGVGREKTCVVRNGVSLERFNVRYPSDATKEEFGIGRGHCVVGCVGRISKEKGHRTLLNSARTVVQEYPESVFLLVGDGPDREELENEFKSESVIFAGIRNDMERLYQCMDVFVLPSLTEGLPMVILEAMASKLPVIATRVGEVPRVVVNGETGVLVEPADEDGLARALIDMLSRRDACEQMGHKGYQRVVEEYSSKQMCKRYMEIYREEMRDMFKEKSL